MTHAVCNVGLCILHGACRYDATSVKQNRSEPVPLCWSDQVARQRVKIMSPRPALNGQDFHPVSRVSTYRFSRYSIRKNLLSGIYIGLALKSSPEVW